MASGRVRISAIGLALTVALSGCGERERPGFGPGGVPLESFTAEQIYERGEFELDRNRPDDAAADLEHLMALTGEPTADSSLLPTYWLCRSAREYCRAAISGAWRRGLP